MIGRNNTCGNEGGVEQLSRLRPDLYAGLNPPPYGEAQRMEKVLARQLRNDGYAVWQR